MNTKHLKQLREYLNKELVNTTQGVLELKEQFFITYIEFSNYQQELTKEELEKTLQNFYDSLVASETNKEDYHQLSAEIFTTRNYFVINKPSLGKKTQNVEMIAEEQYKVLDTVCYTFWTNWAENEAKVKEFRDLAKTYQESTVDISVDKKKLVADIDKWISEYITLTYFTRWELRSERAKMGKLLNDYADSDSENGENDLLLHQAEKIIQQIQGLIESKIEDKNKDGTPNTQQDHNLIAELVKIIAPEMARLQDQNLKEAEVIQILFAKETKECEPIFKIFLAYPETKPIIESIKKWLADYTNLTKVKELKEEVKEVKMVFQKIDDIVNDLNKEEEQKEQTQEPSSYWDRIKQNGTIIAWIAGGISLILVVIGFLKNKLSEN